MDALQIGGFVGAATAGFVATWGAFVRPMKKQLAERPQREEIKQSQRAPNERIGRLEGAVERLISELHDLSSRIERRLDRLDSKMDTVATIEEFRAYSDHTTKAVNQLTEKVGLVTGAVDAIRRG